MTIEDKNKQARGLTKVGLTGGIDSVVQYVR